jgi:hypothetical protein
LTVRHSWDGPTSDLIISYHEKNINPHPILILIECLALVVRDVFWSLWGPMNSLDGDPWSLGAVL